MFAAETLKLDLSPDKREQWMQVSLDSKAWPDALPALRTLCDAGMRMAYLSNFSAPMLDAGVANSGLQGLFEPRLSTHRVGAYRPDPRAHQMAGDAFGMPREAIPFVAFGGWDAAGAKAFGLPTCRVNRRGAPAEELGGADDVVGSTLRDLVNHVACPA